MTTVYPTHWKLDRSMMGRYTLTIYYTIEVDEAGLNQSFQTEDVISLVTFEEALERIADVEEKIRQTN